MNLSRCVLSPSSSSPHLRPAFFSSLHPPPPLVSSSSIDLHPSCRVAISLSLLCFTCVFCIPISPLSASLVSLPLPTATLGELTVNRHPSVPNRPNLNSSLSSESLVLRADMRTYKETRQQIEKQYFAAQQWQSTIETSLRMHHACRADNSWPAAAVVRLGPDVEQCADLDLEGVQYRYRSRRIKISIEYPAIAIGLQSKSKMHSCLQLPNLYLHPPCTRYPSFEQSCTLPW